MMATCKLADEDVPTFSLALENATNLQKTQCHFESPFSIQFTVTQGSAFHILILLEVFLSYIVHIFLFKMFTFLLLVFAITKI